MRTWAHLHITRFRSGNPDMISVKVPGQRIEYASWVSLKDAVFKISEPGRQRCITQGVRNVHAWVVGSEVYRATSAEFTPVMDFPPPSYRRAVYDPWKGGSFVDSERLTPVLTADYVILSGKQVFYASSRG